MEVIINLIVHYSFWYDRLKRTLCDLQPEVGGVVLEDQAALGLTHKLDP